MKYVVIQASSRSNGDTSLVAKAAAQVLEATYLDLLDVDFSRFDYAHKNRTDGFLPLMRRLVEYECLVFVSPVYWYTMSGLLKDFFDRITDCMTIEKETGRKLRGMYMMAISCSNSSGETESFFAPFKLSAEYLGMNYLGELHCQVVDGRIQEPTKAALERFLQKIDGSAT
ncbi:MAG: NAD(P)H-dependent oxidoreductase [Bacteroidota bacterium]